MQIMIHQIGTTLVFVVTIVTIIMLIPVYLFSFIFKEFEKELNS